MDGRTGTALRVTIAAYHYDAEIRDPEEALGRYGTTVGLARGLGESGAEVSVVLRFGRNWSLFRPEGQYRFVRDQAFRMGSVVDRASRMNAAIAETAPDVVHVEGIPFVRQAARLRKELSRTIVILQDHANTPPRRALNRASLARAMKAIDGLFFAAEALADPWREAGIVPAGMPVFEVMEGSTDFTPGDREEARRETGLDGDPLLLWVGRLDANKDPMTVLMGFERFLKDHPCARMAMAYHTFHLLPQMQQWLEARPPIAARVALLGRVPPSKMETLYRAADLFVLGSHHEGSGYALAEAMACGVTPVVTDIPSFAAMTRVAPRELWPPGDGQALATALARAAERACQEDRQNVRDVFEAELSFAAIGRKAVEAYRQILGRRARRTS